MVASGGKRNKSNTRTTRSNKHTNGERARKMLKICMKSAAAAAIAYAPQLILSLCVRELSNGSSKRGAFVRSLLYLRITILYHLLVSLFTTLPCGCADERWKKSGHKVRAKNSNAFSKCGQFSIRFKPTQPQPFRSHGKYYVKNIYFFFKVKVKLRQFWSCAATIVATLRLCERPFISSLANWRFAHTDRFSVSSENRFHPTTRSDSRNRTRIEIKIMMVHELGAALQRPVATIDRRLSDSKLCGKKYRLMDLRWECFFFFPYLFLGCFVWQRNFSSCALAERTTTRFDCYL